MSKTIEELRKELKSKLRKPRSDKGVKRGSYGLRKDTGKVRYQYDVKLPEYSKYIRLKSRLLREMTDNGLRNDKNNYYCLVIRPPRTVYEPKSYISKGKKINRVSYVIAGSTIDLEKYRFNALKEIALLENEFTEKELVDLQYEIRITGALTPLDLFVKFYHLSLNKAHKWTYEHWRHDYSIVAEDVLIDDFVFNYDYAPGSPEFMPEYLEDLENYNLSRKDRLSRTRSYQQERILFKSKLVEELITPVRQTLLKERPDLSPVQLHKKLNKVINEQKDIIDKKVDEHMENWLDKLIEGGE